MLDITVDRSELLLALSVMQNIAERKSSNPLLESVLITAEKNNNLKLMASDEENTVLINLQAKVNTSGQTAVNARMFYEVVKELADGEISLQVTDEGMLEINSGSSHLKLVGKIGAVYPEPECLSLVPEVKIHSEALRKIIVHTSYATAQDDSRFNLSGICFESFEEDGEFFLRGVATDGHRLALVTQPLKSNATVNRVLIPRKGLNELRRLLEGLDQDISFGVDDRYMFAHVQLSNGKTAKLAMRLIDGEFPDYRQVLPKQEGSKIEIEPSRLSEALRRVSLLATDNKKGCRFDVRNGSMELSSSSRERGEAKEELAVDYSGERIVVGFNAGYVMDIANLAEASGSLIMELNGELGAGRFYSKDDKSVTAVVMPMRLTN